MNYFYLIEKAFLSMRLHYFPLKYSNRIVTSILVGKDVVISVTLSVE